jgi:hypothetical protein
LFDVPPAAGIAGVSKESVFAFSDAAKDLGFQPAQ